MYDASSAEDQGLAKFISQYFMTDMWKVAEILSWFEGLYC